MKKYLLLLVLALLIVMLWWLGQQSSGSASYRNNTSVTEKNVNAIIGYSYGYALAFWDKPTQAAFSTNITPSEQQFVAGLKDVLYGRKSNYVNANNIELFSYCLGYFVAKATLNDTYVVATDGEDIGDVVVGAADGLHGKELRSKGASTYYFKYNAGYNAARDELTRTIDLLTVGLNKQKFIEGFSAGIYRRKAGSEGEHYNIMMAYIEGNDAGTRSMQYFAKGYIKLDKKNLVMGVTDRLSGKDTHYNTEQFQQANKIISARSVTAANTAHRLKVEKFFVERAKDPGVVSTGSGLLYVAEKQSKNGEKPGKNDIVKFHYASISTARRPSGNQLLTLALSSLTPGLAEGLQLMSPGDMYVFYVPPQLTMQPDADGNYPKYQVEMHLVELLEIIKQ